MKKIYYLYYIVAIFFIIGCNNEAEQKTNINNIVNNCPCTSIKTFKLKEIQGVNCYLGKSKIVIKSKPGKDTVEVTRFYTEDSVWHVQEYLIISKDQIVYPNYAMYFNFNETSDSYILSFVSNEVDRDNLGVVIDSFLGLEVILGRDTLRSKINNILVPKKIFNGIVKIDKKLGGIYKGERGVQISSMYVEAESLIKYGNLLNQYKAINKFCH